MNSYSVCFIFFTFLCITFRSKIIVVVFFVVAFCHFRLMLVYVACNFKLMIATKTHYYDYILSDVVNNLKPWLCCFQNVGFILYICSVYYLVKISLSYGAVLFIVLVFCFGVHYYVRC